jgi:hypothetical protein
MASSSFQAPGELYQQERRANRHWHESERAWCEVGRPWGAAAA